MLSLRTPINGHPTVSHVSGQGFTEGERVSLLHQMYRNLADKKPHVIAEATIESACDTLRQRTAPDPYQPWIGYNRITVHAGEPEDLAMFRVDDNVQYVKLVDQNRALRL